MLTKDESNQQPQDLLEGLLDYFRERMDVKDGPNGQRLPNEEMDLYLRLNTAVVDLIRSWTMIPQPPPWQGYLIDPYQKTIHKLQVKRGVKT